MSLRSSKILYVFLEVTDISRQRTFCEDIMGLKVIENQFHPPHERHGIVKYDAGDTILSLNLAGPRRLDPHTSDGIVTVFSTTKKRQAEICTALSRYGYKPPEQPEGIFSDGDDHEYWLRPHSPVTDITSMRIEPIMQELCLKVEGLQRSLAFYADVLGLPLIEQNWETATFATGNLRLVLQDGSSFGHQTPTRHNGYLTVFHTRELHKACEELMKRGLQLRSRVRFTNIGGTVRFTDPTGHLFCLYEPSPDCLNWDSGSKVQEIMSSGPGTGSGHQ